MVSLSYLGKCKQMYELRKIYNSLIEWHVFQLLNNLTEPHFRLDLVIAQLRRDLGYLNKILFSIRLSEHSPYCLSTLCG